jgi:hypothetical protein
MPRLAQVPGADSTAGEPKGLGDRIRARGAAHGSVAEVGDDVRDPDAAGDGHPVPAALAVVEQVVAGHAERQLGCSLVGELGSCISRTSGDRLASHSSTRSMRAFSELTFQVAMRIAAPDGPGPTSPGFVPDAACRAA